MRASPSTWNTGEEFSRASSGGGAREIEHVYQANMEEYADDGRVVSVKLGPAPLQTRPNTFQVFGKNSNDVSPVIACRGSSKPPPSPPHGEDCVMGPKYAVTRSWGEGAIIQIKLDFWNDGKEFRITFWGQEITLDDPINIEVVSTVRLGADTVATVRLVPRILTPRPLCSVQDFTCRKVSPRSCATSCVHRRRRPPHLSRGLHRRRPRRAHHRLQGLRRHRQ